MTRRERLIKLLSGIAVIAAGCVIFALSKAYDPKNRAALIGIVAIFFGLTWLGQAIRGHKELVPHRVEAAGAVAAVDPARTIAGVVLAWVLPGLGHWSIGRKQKAVLYFCTITATFVVGVLLAQGRNLDYDRHAVYFLAYMFNGAETGLGWLLTRQLEYDHPIPYLQAGFLYTSVACLLNLVVVIDLYNTCARKGAAAGGGA